LVVTGRVAATTIVEVWAPDEVVIAADGLPTFRGNNLPQHQNLVCKIFCAGKFFFAVAGFANDPITEFSAPKIVGRDLGRELKRLIMHLNS
jgi:ATP-dependent protease HslVU (ClpYQ) peptidase subunit